MNLPYYSASALISLLKQLLGWAALTIGGLSFLIFVITMFGDGKCAECEERDTQKAEIERVEKVEQAKVEKIRVKEKNVMEQSDEQPNQIP